MFCTEISYPFVAFDMKIDKCSKAGANAECCHQIEYYPVSEISYGFKTNVYEQKAEQTTAPDSFAGENHLCLCLLFSRYICQKGDEFCQSVG